MGFETFQLDRLFHFCKHLRGSVLSTPPAVRHRLKAVKFPSRKGRRTSRVSDDLFSTAHQAHCRNCVVLTFTGLLLRSLFLVGADRHS